MSKPFAHTRLRILKKSLSVGFLRPAKRNSLRVSPHCPAPFDYGYLVRLAMQPVLDSIVSLGARSETRLQSTLEPSGLPLRMPFSEKNRRERSELGGSVWSHSLRKYATLTIGLLFVNFPVCPVPTTLRTSILSVW